MSGCWKNMAAKVAITSPRNRYRGTNDGKCKDMVVTILLFATLKDRAGENRLKLNVPVGSSLTEVRGALAANYPALADSLSTAVAAINQEFAFGTESIREG